MGTTWAKNAKLENQCMNSLIKFEDTAIAYLADKDKRFCVLTSDENQNF